MVLLAEVSVVAAVVVEPLLALASGDLVVHRDWAFPGEDQTDFPEGQFVAVGAFFSAKVPFVFFLRPADPAAAERVSAGTSVGF